MGKADVTIPVPGLGSVGTVGRVAMSPGLAGLNSGVNHTADVPTAAAAGGAGKSAGSTAVVSTTGTAIHSAGLGISVSTPLFMVVP